MHALQKQVKSYVEARKAITVPPILDDATVSGRTGLAALERRLDAYLETCPTLAATTRALKGTIKRYAVGMGHAVLAPKSYTSTVDPSIGKEGTDENLSFLRDTLVDCWRTIKTVKLTLSSEPCIPEFHARTLPTLGTPTLQRVRAESEPLATADELRAAADAFESAPSTRQRRDSAGSARSCDPPPINAALIEQRVLVAWNMTYAVRGGGKYTDLFWCPGKITDVSDENTRIAGHGVVGMGWIWVEYDDGSKGWIIASRRGFFGASRAGAWMFEPDDDDDDDEEDGDDAPDFVDADAEANDDDDEDE